MVNNKNILIIEGTTDTSNGNLREGFHKLLVQDLEGAMPRIIMGQGKGQAIDKFRTSEGAALLCDLDSTDEKEIDADLTNYGILDRKGDVFYMIAEMEAWFISQPEILDDFYGGNISSKIPKGNARKIPNPDEFLQKYIRNTPKKAYHKVKHAVELLKRLDANKLKKDFPEYAGLIKCLKGKK